MRPLIGATTRGGIRRLEQYQLSVLERKPFRERWPQRRSIHRKPGEGLRRQQTHVRKALPIRPASRTVKTSVAKPHPRSGWASRLHARGAAQQLLRSPQQGRRKPLIEEGFPQFIWSSPARMQLSSGGFGGLRESQLNTWISQERILVQGTPILGS